MNNNILQMPEIQKRFPPEVLAILHAAERMEVLALKLGGGSPDPVIITGRGWVQDTSDLKEFVRQFLDANWNPQRILKCFDPNYGVRLHSPLGELKMEFCLYCSNVTLAWNGQATGVIPFEREPSYLLYKLARRVGAVRPWWKFWGPKPNTEPT